MGFREASARLHGGQVIMAWIGGAIIVVAGFAVALLIDRSLATARNARIDAADSMYSVDSARFEANYKHIDDSLRAIAPHSTAEAPFGDIVWTYQHAKAISDANITKRHAAYGRANARFSDQEHWLYGFSLGVVPLVLFAFLFAMTWFWFGSRSPRIEPPPTP